MKTLGIRHIALNVADVQKTKEFYIRVMKMQCEWEPDPDNVYLTSDGQDNLAIHRQNSPINDTSSTGPLDHIGFAVSSPDEVDEWSLWVKTCGAKILKELKTHRDGARSFYFEDPNGVVIQLIYHPPIANRAFKQATAD